jgi:hypothetical protein
MKNLFILAVALIIGHTSMAQSAAIVWQKCLGGTAEDVAFSIVQTLDGGYIVAGVTESNDGDISGNHGHRDNWVVKLNSSGAIAWQKCLGGTGREWGRSIVQTLDGGYIVAGNTGSNDGDVSGNHGYEDVWVVKLDSSGATTWQKCLGGTGGEEAYSIVQTRDGGYIVAGLTGSNDGDVSGSHGFGDIWVVKLDSSGAIAWQKCLGGTASEQAFSIVQTLDGGYVVAGQVLSNDGDVSGNHGSGDIWVVKLDSSGAIAWQKCLGGTSDELALSIIETLDGGYIVAGNTRSNDGDVSGNHGFGFYDAWVVKLNSSGAIAWQKCLGGTSDELASSIIQTLDGGYIVAGSASSNDGDVSGNLGYGDTWLVKLDSSGAIIWQKCLGGTGADGANSIFQTLDGGYIVAGLTGSNDGDVSGNHGFYDAWVLKVEESVGFIEESSGSQVSIFPNPSSGPVFVEIPTNGGKQSYYLEIINSLGQLMLISDVNHRHFQIDASTFGGAGIYIIRLKDQKGRTVATQKLLRQ